MKSKVILFCFFQVNVLLSLSQDIGFELHKDQTILTRDSAVLFHDLYLPQGKSPFPSILIRTPYNKEGSAIFAHYFVKKGFAVIVQDVRGKHKSEGEFIPFVNEKKDGRTTLDWLSQQAWCDGNIGLWGSSYLSYCALSLSDIAHPSLKGVFNLSGWIDGSKVNFPGGAFHQMLIIPWLLSEGQNSPLAEKGADMDEMFAHKPLKEAIPGAGTTFKTQSGRDFNMSDFDAPFSYKDVAVPIFHMNGWYDFTAQSTMDAYRLINQYSKVEQHLFMGPWYHNQIYADNDKVGDYQLGPNGVLSLDQMLSIAVDWFNYTLRGIALNTDYQGVHYYSLFEDQWKSCKKWPPNQNLKSFYLEDNQKLITTPNEKDDSYSNFLFDPNTPVPTVGGANFYLFYDKLGVRSQEEVEKRNDVLTFSTKKFENEAFISGAVNVYLHVGTEGKGTDFTAKLTLVDEENNSFNLADGIIRVLPSEVQNKVFEVQIELGDIALKVGKGQQLRLQISSSNYPKFNRNPNTGIDPIDATKFIAVKQTIHHSSRYPSRIDIPFLKD